MTPTLTVAEAMRTSGIVEEHLNLKIANLTVELKIARQSNHRKKLQLKQLQTHCKRCWGCRFTHQWKMVRGKIWGLLGQWQAMRVSVR